jgi:hypothetical protein
MPRVMRVVRAPDSLEHTRELIPHRQRRHFIFVLLVKRFRGWLTDFAQHFWLYYPGPFRFTNGISAQMAQSHQELNCAARLPSIYFAMEAMQPTQ